MGYIYGQLAFKNARAILFFEVGRSKRLGWRLDWKLDGGLGQDWGKLGSGFCGVAFAHRLTNATLVGGV